MDGKRNATTRTATRRSVFKRPSGQTNPLFPLDATAGTGQKQIFVKPSRRPRIHKHMVCIYNAAPAIKITVSRYVPFPAGYARTESEKPIATTESGLGRNCDPVPASPAFRHNPGTSGILDHGPGVNFCRRKPAGLSAGAKPVQRQRGPGESDSGGPAAFLAGRD